MAWTSRLLIPTPLHTHQLPWPDFCEFLDTWNAELELKEKMKKMEKAHRHLRHPSQQASPFFPLLSVIYRAVLSYIQVSQAWLSITSRRLYAQAWDAPYYLNLINEGKWKKAIGPVRLSTHFSIDLVIARFRRIAALENGEPLSYTWKTNLRLTKWDIFFYLW